MAQSEPGELFEVFEVGKPRPLDQRIPQVHVTDLGQFREMHKSLVGDLSREEAHVLEIGERLQMDEIASSNGNPASRIEKWRPPCS
jgi:hypothetical protein